MLGSRAVGCVTQCHVLFSAWLLQDISISVLAPAPAAVVESQLYIPQLAAASRGAAAAEVQLVFLVPGSSSDGPPAVLPATNVAEVWCTAASSHMSHGWFTSPPGFKHKLSLTTAQLAALGHCIQLTVYYVCDTAASRKLDSAYLHQSTWYL
jgi:hypothetical protein